MANTAANVTAAKPGTGGAIWVAPKGTPLPTSATEELNEAFVSLGYISTDGLTNSKTRETETIEAWGGDKVLPLNQGGEDTFSATFIEALNPDVLKFIHGSEYVSGTLDTGITVKVGNRELEEYAIVANMIKRGGVIKRVCIPDGYISELGEVAYNDEGAVGYQATISALANSEGDTHYEYISKAA